MPRTRSTLPAYSRWAVAVAAAMLMLVAAACGSDGTEDNGVPTGETLGYSGLIAAGEFVVGPNRFPFALVSVDGEFLEDTSVSVGFFSLNQPEPELLSVALAEWRVIQGETPHQHPDGDVHIHLDFRGLYVVDEVVIPEAGIWGAEFEVAGAPGEFKLEGAAFQVLDAPVAPGVGQEVPPTNNPTIHDVLSFAELSTRQVEDEMHNVSVAQALEAGEPFVVGFASPQFCVSAMCGPVTDTLAQAHDAVRGGAEFIHIEPWNLDFARNEGRLVPSRFTVEWRLPSEPWTFVIGADGRVAARFEGLVTKDEILDALEPLL